MADRHRIGTFDATSGRFTSLLDINDLSTYSLARGSFKITPFAETSLYAQSTRRYGGSRQVGETHDNGTVEATWMIAAATGDLVLAAKDALFTYFESARLDLFYEWRPDGATRSTYFELRGGLPWEPMYQWVEFSGARVLQVRGGWQIAPLAVGDPMDVRDDFSTDTVAAGDYTIDAGGSTIAVSGGQLAPTNTTTKAFCHTARGYLYTDAQVTIKHTPDTVTAYEIGPSLRRLDANNYLFCTITGGGGLNIYKRDGGSNTLLSSVGGSALSLGVSYWVRFRAEGNVLYAEHFTSQPTPLSTPTNSVSHTLSGGNATKFGIGIMGGNGVGWWTPITTNARIDDLEILPYTYRRAGAQTVAAHEFELNDIPGTAPAVVDIYTTSPSGTEPESALTAWATNLYPGEVVDRPIRLVDFSGAADANSSGGAYYANLSPAFTLWPEYVPSDDFTDSISVEVWAIIKTNGTSGGSVVASAFTSLDVNARIYTAEHGAGGRTFRTISSGRIITRAGTLTLPSQPSPDGWAIGLALSGANVQGIDCAIIVPARQRACTSTGQVAADSQKWLDPSTARQYEKVVRHDLSAGLRDASVASRAMVPAQGLSGQMLEFPPGDVTVLHRLGASVVDATDQASTEDLATSTMTVHYAIVPRYHLARAS